MNRRTLFGKVLAAAAVVAVGPAVTSVATAPAAAAPEPLTGPEWWALEHDRMAKLIAQGFSEPDYVSPEIIVGRAFGQDVWARNPRYREPLTFEAMQADCAARGCELVPSPISISQHPRTITHIDRRSRWAGYDYSVDSQENVLARVDVWRTSLHGAG